MVGVAMVGALVFVAAAQGAASSSRRHGPEQNRVSPSLLSDRSRFLWSSALALQGHMVIKERENGTFAVFFCWVTISAPLVGRMSAGREGRRCSSDYLLFSCFRGARSWC